MALRLSVILGNYVWHCVCLFLGCVTYVGHCICLFVGWVTNVGHRISLFVGWVSYVGKWLCYLEQAQLINCFWNI